MPLQNSWNFYLGKGNGFNSKRVFLSCVGHYYLHCVVPMERHLQYLRSWRLLWVLIGLSTSHVIGQNLPVTYRFNGTNAFTTVNYILKYSSLDYIVIHNLVTGRRKSFWPGTCPWPDQNSREGWDQPQFTCWVRIWEGGSQNACYFAFAASIEYRSVTS